MNLLYNVYPLTMTTYISRRTLHTLHTLQVENEEHSTIERVRVQFLKSHLFHILSWIHRISEKSNQFNEHVTTERVRLEFRAKRPLFRVPNSHNFWKAPTFVYWIHGGIEEFLKSPRCRCFVDWMYQSADVFIYLLTYLLVYLLYVISFYSFLNFW